MLVARLRSYDDFSLLNAETCNPAGAGNLAWKERAAETMPEEDDGKLTIEEFDAIVNKWDKLQEKLGIEKAREAAANAERMRLPNMMEIFSACLQSMDRSPVLTACAITRARE